ncbi:uncharacterized protein LOC115418636 isoform X2 [Sphaeramia orbicularis]|uniref:uncharacterized protein LOC115418636 isoform X2 n=1 Tax=Sphaeramia orbicularis TaxID=375764 RepID=UPI001180EEEC|nr:uncharacterized protein LOC115418636 isoform X2 [Sphaeramia orbicularis]
MTTSSDVQCHSKCSRLSSDSGIYVPLEIPFSELEETVDDKENLKSLVITFHDKDKELAEKEPIYQNVNVVINSNPGLGLVGSTTLVNPEVSSTSRSDVPPPVPPQYLKPKFKARHEEIEPLKTCQKTPLLNGATGSNQSSRFIPGEELNTSNTNLTLLPHESPEKHHEPKMSDTEERRTEWEAKETEKDKMTRQQQSLLEKHKMAESIEDKSVTERHQDVDKHTAGRETLVIFNNEFQSEDGDQQMGLEAGWLTRLLMSENVAESTDEDSDFSSEEEDDISEGNAEPVSAKPQPKPLPAPPPNIQKKCPPKLPAKPPSHCYARRPDVEEKEERMKKEEDEQQGKEERCEHVKCSTFPGHGQTTQPNHKKQSKGMKTFTKFIDKLKENREEKKRVKAGEMTMDRGREQDAEVWDKEKCKEEKRLKDKENEETGDNAVDQTPVTPALRHVELMSTMDKRTNASSDSVFGSFKVNVPVMLVEDLLSGEQWSQFLGNNQKPDPPPLWSNSEDTAQLIPTVLHSEDHQDAVAVLDEHIYEEMPPYDPSNIMAGSQTRVEQKRVVSSVPVIVLETETVPLSPRTRDMLDSVEFLQPHMDTNMFSDFQSEEVLDTSVQKYLIKLSGRRKRRAPLHHRWHRNKKNDLSSQPPYSTSPGKRISSSVFYNVQCSGVEEPPPTVESGRGSPRTLTKIKMALKSTTTKGGQRKVDGTV